MGSELRVLIQKMALADPLWGAPRIHGELLKLFLVEYDHVVEKLSPNRADHSLGVRVLSAIRITPEDLDAFVERGRGTP